MSDRQYMVRAIALARKCTSEAGRISPKVGAVLVLRGKIVGEAFRGEFHPGEHAEYTLLERKLNSKALAGATLYTTLEPCTSRNHPKVPCADRIIERRIRRVVVGTIDHNETIRGLGELRLRGAGIEIARFDSDLMAKVEELNRDFIRLHRANLSRKRSKSATTDPVMPNEHGPNGHRIGYTPDGDKVEWIPDEENPGKEWPLVLRRNDKSILKLYEELHDKVWWNRHQVWLENLRSGKEKLTKGQKALFIGARKAAQRIERKCGRKNLGWDDFEWGMLNGKLSAISWVMGSDWESSLDT